MSESRIITDPRSGLTYHVKSFPFEFKKTYYDPGKNEGAFSGYLIISLEDKQIFSEKTFADGAYTGRGRINHFPFLYNHDTLAPLGYGFLTFITCFYPRVDLLQTWNLQFMGLLPLEIPKAEELYARLKEEGKDVIKEISIGHNLIEPGIKAPYGRVKVYEISIEEVSEKQ